MAGQVDRSAHQSIVERPGTRQALNFCRTYGPQMGANGKKRRDNHPHRPRGVVSRLAALSGAKEKRMTMVGRWSGKEARALREARRMTIREFASHLGVSDRVISKWEAGGERIHPRPINQAALDTSLARSNPEVQERFSLSLASPPLDAMSPLSGKHLLDPMISCTPGLELSEIDDMDRRELLRLLTLAGTLLTTVATEDALDWERLSNSDRGSPHQIDPLAPDEYAALNVQLWKIYAMARPKSIILPLVRQHLSTLINGCQNSSSDATYRRMCGLIGDLSQLAGEILLDLNQYTDAAHCYTLAATACKEAEAFDLWACALTRHAFISMYDRRFERAVPILNLASDLANRGNLQLSTRYWISAVQAQTFAGLDDLQACERALNKASEVRDLDGVIHNSGWLRFDGSRLAEERGACYVRLKRPGLAEPALTEALTQGLSARRHGSVLVDLAALALQNGSMTDLRQYADRALEMTSQTNSGVVSTKLAALRRELAPHLAHSYVRQLDMQIANLVGGSQ